MLTHISIKLTPLSIPSRIYMIRQQSGDMVMNYFDHLKAVGVNIKSSTGNLTKHAELEKIERDYGNTTNLDKMVEVKFSATDFLECDEPGRYKTL